MYRHRNNYIADAPTIVKACVICDKLFTRTLGGKQHTFCPICETELAYDVSEFLRDVMKITDVRKSLDELRRTL